MEWQHRNLRFWIERYPTPLIIYASLTGLGVSAILTLFYSNIRYVSLFFVAGFGVMFLTIVALTSMNICYGKRLPLNQFWNAIRNNLSIENIIENRLCVCRDYTKLTSCLLSRLCSNTDVFYAHTSTHVAVGIVSNEQLYMLDQRLPILTIHQWDTREKSKGIIHKSKDGKFEQVKDLTQYRKNQQSLGELIKQLKDSGITINSITNAKPIRVIKWRKGALLYSMNDEVVNYSLAQRIKYEVTNDLLDFKKIRIEIKENGEDLEFLIKNP